MKHETTEKLDIYAILKKYWGYSEFRPMQREIINSVLAGRDTLALLPTGGGKSLTYQIPALMNDGVCIVVTPLIALMKDQVDRLRSLSIPAVTIHSGLSPRQVDIALDNCVYGDIKFLYVSPERVANEVFRCRVQRMNISMIAVDEAHCISQWGYDFRPSYLKIAELRKHTGGVPILALTASATKNVMADIAKQLKFKDENIIQGSFARPNLTYAIRKVEDKEMQIVKVLESVPGSGIIYVRSRGGAEKLAEELNKSGVTATFYHAGLPYTERSIRQDEWIKNEVRVIVATNAFGMGIDKPDVRFVIHYTMCDSLENYYQEAGRAGRDGKRSYAVLLTNDNDERLICSQLEAEFPPLEKIKDIYDKICSSLQIAIGDGAYSSYMFNIYEFCAREKLFRGVVLSAIKILEYNGYISLIDEMVNPARVMFCVSRDDLYKVRVAHDDLDHFLRVLLRLYEGLFSDFRQISEVEIAHWSGYDILKVKDLLKRLWQMRLIRYVPSNQSPLIYLGTERLSIADLYISPESYALRKELTTRRHKGMMSYVKNNTTCRSRCFEDYFGVEDANDCGVCDICLERKRKKKVVDTTDTEQVIANMLIDRELTIKEIAESINLPTEKIVKCIDNLINREKVVILKNGKIKLAEQS
ncbi:MAG: ATP-dependent DNA helicase RecQ [Rikenellaceae bacterium]